MISLSLLYKRRVCSEELGIWGRKLGGGMWKVLRATWVEVEEEKDQKRDGNAATAVIARWGRVVFVYYPFCTLPGVKFKRSVTLPRLICWRMRDAMLRPSLCSRLFGWMSREGTTEQREWGSVWLLLDKCVLLSVKRWAAAGLLCGEYERSRDLEKQRKRKMDIFIGDPCSICR